MRGGYCGRRVLCEEGTVGGGSLKGAWWGSWWGDRHGGPAGASLCVLGQHAHL